MKRINKTIWILLLGMLIIIASDGSAQEVLQFSTYYPNPSWQYQRLRLDVTPIFESNPNSPVQSVFSYGTASKSSCGSVR